MELILLDMGALEYRRSDGMLRVEAPHVGVLFAYRLGADESLREAVFQALDGILESVELPSSAGPWYRVALYNPATCQIAVGGVPGTEVFGDGRPVTIPSYGLLISRGAFEGSPHLELEKRVLPECAASTRETQAALAAH